MNTRFYAKCFAYISFNLYSNPMRKGAVTIVILQNEEKHREHGGAGRLLAGNILRLTVE